MCLVGEAHLTGLHGAGVRAQEAGDLSRVGGLLGSLARNLGRLDLFTVTADAGADLRQVGRALQLLAGFCGAPGRQLPADVAQAAAAASHVLRCFLKPNATGGQYVVCHVQHRLCCHCILFSILVCDSTAPSVPVACLSHGQKCYHPSMQWSGSVTTMH